MHVRGHSLIVKKLFPFNWLYIFIKISLLTNFH